MIHAPAHLVRRRIERAREALAAREVPSLLVTAPGDRGYLSGYVIGGQISFGGLILLTGSAQVFITAGVDEESCAEHAVPLGFEVFAYRRTRGQTPWSVAADAAAGLGLDTVAVDETRVTVSQRDEIVDAFAAKGCTVTGVRGAISDLRREKDDWEVAQIKAANDVGRGALERVVPLIGPGMSEWGIAVALENAVRELTSGSQRMSFGTIVVSGPRTSLPHGAVTNRLIERGDLVTIDFGPTYNGYCSDITRTFVVGKASQRQREIYDAVILAQRAAIGAISPGRPRHDAARAGEAVLDQLGLVDYAPHGAGGHGLGLEIEEGPSTADSEPWSTGNVVTIEPGVYIPGWGGVRIEDDIAVTSHGHERLTTIATDRWEL